VTRFGLDNAFGWALLVHGGMLALLFVLPHSKPDTSRGVAPPPPTSYELEIEPAVPSVSSAPSGDDGRLAPVDPAHARPVHVATRVEPDRATSGPGGEPRVDVIELGPTAASDTAWTFSPLRASPVDLGIGSSGKGAGLARGSVTESPPVPGSGHGSRSDGAIASVRMGLDAHDRELGLGAAGPLVEATRDAVSFSLVSNVAHALLEFTTDRSGLVVSVRVLDANADRRAWEDVSLALTKSSRDKPLRVPPGAAGVAVTMQVESKVTLPSGHDAGETAFSILGVPLKTSTAEHPIRVDVTSVLGGNIDPTDALMDAAAKPRRVVLAWVVSERRL
jgi:hypothetical protein